MYLLCFQDEDIYTFFEPELPSEPSNASKGKGPDSTKSGPDNRKPTGKASSSRNSSRASQPGSKKSQTGSGSDKRASPGQRAPIPNAWQTTQDSVSWREGSSVLDLNGDHYFSCAVNRKRSNARYLLKTSDDVVSFLKDLADAAATFPLSAQVWSYILFPCSMAGPI